MIQKNMTAESEDPSGTLLELAADDDLLGFKNHVDRHPSLVDGVATWYGRRKGSAQMALHRLTPFMVAAIYGSLDVLKLILTFPNLDVNQNCGADNTTALHCAASSGSPNAVDIIKHLLAAGADPNLTDANGRRPINTIFIPPNLQATKCTLQTLLATDDSDPNSPTENPAGGIPCPCPYPPTPTAPEKREYPADLSLPDMKNTLYSSDEFRMFSFKVRQCSRAYSHDWTECPFVHPGENARRRDPRKYHYSCVPCPDFRKGACRRGDICEYAHGVFECWLHPAQYRTRLCKDGTTCYRRVCFFAHTHEELRPLYISTGSAVPSPSFTPPMSPSANSISPKACWPQNVPPLQQSSRLRSSINARDMDNSYQNLHLKSLPPNLDDLFSLDGSNSPRFSNVSTTHKFKQGTLLSPIKTSFSQSPFSNADPISPMSARVSMLTQQDRFRSASLDENWSNWGANNGAVTGDELGSSMNSFENLSDGEEPDFSWVQSLVKESSQDLREEYEAHLAGDVGDTTTTGGGVEDQSVLGSWIEQMQLDQLVAQ